MTRIAVIGGGRIGEALIAGLLEAGRLVKDLVVVETRSERATQLVDRFGVRVTDSISDATPGADLLVIAVKPADIEGVLTELSKADLDSEREQTVVSLAAGMSTARIEAKLPAGFPVVRVMPNTPMLVGEGMSVVAPGRYAKPNEVAVVTEMLATVGQVTVVDEAHMDAATALSGSGPAYFFLIAEAMIDAGVGLGLRRDIATQLVVQTMLGSATMLVESGQDAGDLRAAVTSPAGTTAAALREMERSGIRSTFWEALYAARDRSAELGGDAD